MATIPTDVSVALEHASDMDANSGGRGGRIEATEALSGEKGGSEICQHPSLSWLKKVRCRTLMGVLRSKSPRGGNRGIPHVDGDS